MQYSEGQLGRVFVLRLEHHEPLPQTLEEFLAEHNISHGMAVMVGGVDTGSRLVVGPEDGRELPVHPMVSALVGAREIAALGTIFPTADGRAVLHMHAACGRHDETVTGCIRAGIKTWQILEIIVLEIVGVEAARLADEATGFNLLCCGVEATCRS